MLAALIILKIEYFTIVFLIAHTVNGERFAGLNFHGFRGFQEHHKGFSVNISASLK